jgi:hypothetical protein
MFRFIYKGNFDCLITKDVFETHMQNLYYDMKKRFNIKWSPKKIIITMDMNSKKSKGWGGTTNYDRKTDIVYRLELQLYGYTKKEQTFEILQKLFSITATHEMLHFFIPYVQNNPCWSEGVTDFMTFWFNDTISDNLTRLKREYLEITNKEYKSHKYGYITGFKKMAALYKKDKAIITDIIQMIKDFNKNDNNKKKNYEQSDIISYNAKFKTFFIGKCNQHYTHSLNR